MTDESINKLIAEDPELQLMLRRSQELARQQDRRVVELGEEIGYGFIMHSAERMWRAKLTSHPKYPTPGGEFAVGCCAAFMVPCECKEEPDPEKEHCEWCCGSGRVTERVRQAQKECRDVSGTT